MDFNVPADSGKSQDRVESLQASEIGSALVEDNLFVSAVRCDSVLEKPVRYDQINGSDNRKSSAWPSGQPLGISTPICP